MLENFLMETNHKIIDDILLDLRRDSVLLEGWLEPFELDALPTWAEDPANGHTAHCDDTVALDNADVSAIPEVWQYGTVRFWICNLRCNNVWCARCDVRVLLFFANIGSTTKVER